MKTLNVLFVVLLAGCSMQNTPPPMDGVDGKNGVDGAPGMVGPQGPKGDKGDKGDPGVPGAALTISQVDGGAVVTDADGGIAMLTVVIGPPGPKGDKGDQGMPGMNGAQGIQGPVGPTPSTLTVYDADGGEVGQPIFNNGGFSLVYSKQLKCVVQIDFESNTLSDQETVMYFTGANCSGMAFASTTVAKPIGCAQVAGQHYRARQPIYMGSMNAQSRMQSSTTADGGSTFVCVSSSLAVYGVVMEAFTWTNISGPFSFGSN